MPSWPKEYVELLRRNIEEYSNVDFIDNRGDVASNSNSDVQESTSGKISVHHCVLILEMLIY